MIAHTLHFGACHSATSSRSLYLLSPGLSRRKLEERKKREKGEKEQAIVAHSQPPPGATSLQFISPACQSPQARPDHSQLGSAHIHIHTSHTNTQTHKGRTGISQQQNKRKSGRHSNRNQKELQKRLMKGTHHRCDNTETLGRLYEPKLRKIPFFSLCSLESELPPHLHPLTPPSTISFSFVFCKVGRLWRNLCGDSTRYSNKAGGAAFTFSSFQLHMFTVTS